MWSLYYLIKWEIARPLCYVVHLKIFILTHLILYLYISAGFGVARDLPPLSHHSAKCLILLTFCLIYNLYPVLVNFQFFPSNIYIFSYQIAFPQVLASITFNINKMWYAAKKSNKRSMFLLCIPSAVKTHLL